MATVNTADLAKKTKFEKRLCERANERTITDVVTDIGSHMGIRITPLSEMLCGVVAPGFEDTARCNVLAGYKDGVALTIERGFPNGMGITNHYFLHRNGEKVVYVLPEQLVEFKRV
ncbi:MAG: hypothetical protein WC852_07120 [Candidatus Nanoarchaeia archaeon]|jgi:hypothetical protein